MVLEHLKDVIKGTAAIGELRDPGWPKVRAAYLKRFPTCAACGTKRKLNVHHITPFQFAPSKQLDPDNLITLCRGGRFKGLNCHLIFGHRGHYQKVNEAVEAVAAEWAVYLDAKAYRLSGGK